MEPPAIEEIEAASIRGNWLARKIEPAAMCIYTARHGALTDLAGILSTAEVMTIGGHTVRLSRTRRMLITTEGNRNRGR
jgi:hypothetical protein